MNENLVLPCSPFDLECDYKTAKVEALKLYKNHRIESQDF